MLTGRPSPMRWSISPRPMKSVSGHPTPSSTEISAGVTFVQFKADGSVDYVHDSRSDAKEVDPKYADVIDRVEAEVTAEMKKDGTHGQFGSCHSFWSRKKEKLKERGIVWRSPSELNPDTCFD